MAPNPSVEVCVIDDSTECSIRCGTLVVIEDVELNEAISLPISGARQLLAWLKEHVGEEEE